MTVKVHNPPLWEKGVRVLEQAAQLHFVLNVAQLQICIWIILGYAHISPGHQRTSGSGLSIMSIRADLRGKTIAGDLKYCIGMEIYCEGSKKYSLIPLWPWGNSSENHSVFICIFVVFMQSFAAFKIKKVLRKRNCYLPCVWAFLCFCPVQM